MNLKADRKSRIIEILNTRKIGKQEELLEILRQEGIEVTQATLSRDMRNLGAVKVHDMEDGFHYRIPTDGKDSSGRFILKVEASGQFCVVKTQPGYASAIASVIDNAFIPGVMGTIAGDDTVLAIIRMGADNSKIVASIKSLK